MDNFNQIEGWQDESREHCFGKEIVISFTQFFIFYFFFYLKLRFEVNELIIGKNK